MDVACLARIVEERDRLYEERHEANEKAVAAAFCAGEKQTATALENQKESVRKAEESQKEYNRTHNDLLKRMDKQYEELFPRREFTQLHQDLINRVDSGHMTLSKEMQHLREFFNSEIADLKESRSESLGEKTASARAAATGKWIIGILSVAATALLVNLVHYWLAASEAHALVK